MVKLLSTLVLILTIILFPPAVLALVSSNAVPGDTTYPIKRSLEDGIFAVASLNPTSRAWFAVARSDRRFKEVTVLITQGKKASVTLDELVTQTDSAVNEITKIENVGQKKQLLDQVQKSLEKYDQGLEEISQKVSQNSNLEHEPTPTIQPITTTTPRLEQQPPLTVSQEEQERQLKELEDARKRFEEIRKKAEEELRKAEDARRMQEQERMKLEEERRKEEGRKIKEQEELSRQKKEQQTVQKEELPGFTEEKNPSPTPSSSGSTRFRLFSVPSTSQLLVPTTTPVIIQTPTPVSSCFIPAKPSGLSYNSDTKTVSWDAVANAAYYNVRLVTLNSDQYNFDNITNTWYTFADDLIAAPGSYSWWVDAVNECGADREGAAFTVLGVE